MIIEYKLKQEQLDFIENHKKFKSNYYYRNKNNRYPNKYYQDYYKETENKISYAEFLQYLEQEGKIITEELQKSFYEDDFLPFFDNENISNTFTSYLKQLGNIRVIAPFEWTIYLHRCYILEEKIENDIKLKLNNLRIFLHQESDNLKIKLLPNEDVEDFFKKNEDIIFSLTSLIQELDDAIYDEQKGYLQYRLKTAHLFNINSKQLPILLDYKEDFLSEAHTLLKEAVLVADSIYPNLYEENYCYNES